MALAREISGSENAINYISTVAFFCVLSCAIVMLRFGGFKATFNLLSKGKKVDIEEYERAPGEPICGAYRISRDEFYTDTRAPDPPKKITPSMVQLPPSRRPIEPSRSTENVTKPTAMPAVLHKSTPNVSQEPQRQVQNKNLVKEQKKIEKQQQAEQRKQDKAAAKEEKLRKEREKQAQKLQEKEKAKSKKLINKQNKMKQTNQQPAVDHQTTGPQQPSAPTQYSTNTLESSISKSSGPPPYSPAEVVPKPRDQAGNISFAESKEDLGSWDMISQHRQQIRKQTTVKGATKQTHMDLQYNAGTSKDAAVKNINDA